MEDLHNKSEESFDLKTDNDLSNDTIVSTEMDDDERTMEKLIDCIESCNLYVNIKSRMLRYFWCKLSKVMKFQEDVEKLGGSKDDVETYLSTLCDAEQTSVIDFCKRKIPTFHMDFSMKMERFLASRHHLKEAIGEFKKHFKQSNWPIQKVEVAKSALHYHVEQFQQNETYPNETTTDIDEAIHKIEEQIKKVLHLSADIDSLHQIMNRIRLESVKLESLDKLGVGEIDTAFDAMLVRLEYDNFSNVIASAKEVLVDVQQKANVATKEARVEMERKKIEARRKRSLLTRMDLRSHLLNKSSPTEATSAIRNSSVFENSKTPKFNRVHHEVKNRETMGGMNRKSNILASPKNLREKQTISKKDIGSSKLNPSSNNKENVIRRRLDMPKPPPPTTTTTTPNRTPRTSTTTTTTTTSKNSTATTLKNTLKMTSSHPHLKNNNKTSSSIPTSSLKMINTSSSSSGSSSSSNSSTTSSLKITSTTNRIPKRTGIVANARKSKNSNVEANLRAMNHAFGSTLKIGRNCQSSLGETKISLS